jgi:uncharacterized protein YuzE
MYSVKLTDKNQMTILFGSNKKNLKLENFSYTTHDPDKKITLVMNDQAILTKIVIDKASDLLLDIFNLSPQKIKKSLSIKYDRPANSAYIYITKINPGEVSLTYPFDPYEIGAEINLDFNKDEKLLGIEILNANKHLPTELLN